MAYTPSLDDINEMEGANTVKQFSKPSTPPDSMIPNVAPMLMRGAQDVSSGIMGGLANTGQAIANIPNAVANIPHMMGYGPQVNMPNPSMQPGGVQDFVNTLGPQNPTMADKLLQGVGQYAPFNMVGNEVQGAMQLPRAASYLGSLAQKMPVQGMMGGMFGLSQNPNNPTQGGEIGAGLGALNAVAPEVNQLANFIRPQKYLNTILGGIANTVKDAKAQYQPVFDAVGNNSIYPGANQTASAYNTLPPNIFKSFDGKIDGLNSNFQQNPTFQNAHALQSQMGTLIGKLQNNDLRGTLSMADRDRMQAIQTAQGALRTDMHGYLQGVDPSLSNQYANATQNWASNVAPYFSKPYVSASIKKYIADPDTASSVVPEKFLAGLKGINGDLPSLNEQMTSLNSKIGLRNLAQRGVGAAVGAHLFPGAEEAGVLIGGMLGPQVSRGINSAVPLHQINQGLTGASSYIAPYLRQSLIANAARGNSNGS